LFPRSTVDQSSSSLSSRNAAPVKPAIKVSKNGKRSSYKLLLSLGKNRSIRDISKIRESWVTMCALVMVSSTRQVRIVDLRIKTCAQIPHGNVSTI